MFTGKYQPGSFLASVKV